MANHALAIGRRLGGLDSSVFLSVIPALGMASPAGANQLYSWEIFGKMSNDIHADCLGQ